ncbi:hypothetical protein RF55_14051 [Lasius niger]|uniref:Peptidase A2 domain-containing protein n=1 Tax=Lasius niger TaxID=67767 RepID=A0A0J7N2H1_LASNI|nr:hypothetical protein RF55_14051 [Lasius niger]
MDLNTLLQSQTEIHGRISRSVDNLRKMGSANITLSAVETRIRIIDQLWAKFEAQHDLIRAGYKERFDQSEYSTSDIFEDTENTYVLQRSALDEYANRYKAAPAAPAPGGELLGDRAPKTALPRIKLQNFSGAYADWPSFRDLFQSVIGENASISNIERFHYLRSCLQGPAEKLIRPLAVTGENYDRAWAILAKHYENKKELIRSNFAAFTAVGRMKGDTAEELSRIYHAVTTAVNAAESIGRPIESNGMDLFNHFVIELFDSRTRLEWESSTSDSLDPPDHSTLLSFISKRILTLNAAKPKNVAKAPGDSSRSAKAHLAKRGSDAAQCVICKEKHSIMMCREFKAKSASERKSIVESSKLCYNCLGNHPVARCQSLKNCFTCKARHHTLLHDAYAATKVAEVSTLSAFREEEDRKAILLATARVTVADRYGNPHTIRALIDQGSEVSLISEALVQQLRLPRTHSAVSIIGIGGARSGATRGKVKLALTSKATGAEFSAVAFILPRLSSYQGTTMTSSTAWPHIKRLTLAEPHYLKDDPVDVLLGAEVYSIILEDGLRKGGPHAPIAQRTILGWILSGGVEGRYIVRLPFSLSPMNLAETRKPAERLLTTMERKSSQDSRFGQLYRMLMREYEDLQHMQLLANDIETRFPRGAASLQRDCYVDDIVTEANSLSDAISLQTELRKLCMAGGFPLRKWAANCKEILTGIPPEHRTQKTPLAWESEVHSTLGLRWHPSTNHFAFEIHQHSVTGYTKRRVLAETARLFDPLGYLAPVIIRAKILIQSALLQQLKWDAPLPSADARRWKLFLEELPLLKRVRIHRWLGTSAEVECAELHASTFLWTDSKVVLHWIRGHASQWKTYVVNSVSYIQQHLPEARWQHIPGRDNPADCASRGISPNEIVNHPLWWTGPPWLCKENSCWPNERTEIREDNLPEKRVVAHQSAQQLQSEPELLLRFSSLHRLQRVTAWCLRWRRATTRGNERVPFNTKQTLQTDELDAALFQWIPLIQRIHYPEEVSVISAHRLASPRSKLAK